MAKKGHAKRGKANGDAKSEPTRRRRGPRQRASWAATHGSDLKFLLIFFTLIGLYYAATSTSIVKERFFPWYLHLNAEVSAVVLNGLGHGDVVAHDRVLGSKSFRMNIARGCDGVDPSALYIAAVLASPVAFRRKWPAVVIGTGLLLTLNVVRIISLYFTGIYFKSLFEMMHLDVWQAGFIIMALMFWAIWAHRIGRSNARQAHAT
ncbi:MAG: hypothetical protein ACE5E5_04715 [Phycisphaerae bacterium]